MKEHYNIILIDDDNMFNYLHRKVLEKTGCFNVINTFENAPDALDFIQDTANTEAAVILLDINMPGMNGWDFLKALAALPETITARYKTIMLSSSISSEDVKQSQQYPHVYGYLFKPLDVEMLTDILQRITQVA